MSPTYIGYSKETDSSASAAVTCTNNQEIKTADIFKVLGVIIDSRLNFSEHVSLACIKASQRIGVLMFSCATISYLLPLSVTFL